MTDTQDRLLRKEETKRLRCWDPALRLRALQDTLDWAERQLPTPRNSPAECLRLERKRLARHPHP